jgi:hypothetical protein
LVRDAVRDAFMVGYGYVAWLVVTEQLSRRREAAHAERVHGTGRVEPSKSACGRLRGITIGPLWIEPSRRVRTTVATIAEGSSADKRRRGRTKAAFPMDFSSWRDRMGVPLRASVRRLRGSDQ